MTENEGRPEPEAVLPDQYDPGARSITRRGPGRKELLAEQRQTKIRSRPWIIGGALLLIALLAFPIYAFVATFTLPPREIAVRVEDSTYTRGDVVDFIRFRQRLTEEVGGQFELGTSLFEALQVIQDNEIAFKLAPQLGISVSPDEVDLEVEFLLQMSPQGSGRPPNRRVPGESCREEAPVPQQRRPRRGCVLGVRAEGSFQEQGASRDRDRRTAYCPARPPV